MRRIEKKKRPTTAAKNTSQEPFFKAVQTKVAIGEPNDHYEKEADAMADVVTSGGTANKNITSKTQGQGETQSKPLAQQITPLVQRAPEEEAQAKVQRAEEEEAQTKVQRAEEEEAQTKVQKMEEEEPQAKLQRAEEEEEAQAKGATKSSVKPAMETSLKSKKGGGSKMDSKTKSEMETGFGADFSGVSIHTDSKAQEMSDEIGAQAFTYGNDVYFNQGKYNPQSQEGKHLLAHELTHTIQQGKSKADTTQNVQRKDTGWRYTPPKSVGRSIQEIQATVGATPDGVYGPGTKAAVDSYQKVLKSKGFYSDTVDGKWGKNTEAGHVKFGFLPNSIRRGYNCTGFATKKFVWLNLAPTKALYAGMKKLPSIASKCDPFDFKFWLWEVDIQVHNTRTGRVTSKSRDFHTVGGRTHKDGSDPKTVMSKNGGRPLEGPGSPTSFKLKSGPAPDGEAKPHPFLNWIVTPVATSAFCSKKLP
jgi:hypothetical protein